MPGFGTEQVALDGLLANRLRANSFSITEILFSEKKPA